MSPTSSDIDRRRVIRDGLMAASRTVQTADFLRADAADLRRLLDAYDRLYFDGALSAGVRATGGPLTLEWSNRLRSSGGMTVRLKQGGVVSYRIAVSRPLIMDNFRGGGPMTVVGVQCHDRLDALMRIMEHELLHLFEFLTYGRSNCAKLRFRTLAERHFGHAAHQHRLTTPRQRVLAATAIRPGTVVSFVHDGRTLVGRVNRIHTRATVLVPSERGTRYTDGGRYEKFYVPVGRLQVPSPSTPPVPSPGVPGEGTGGIPAEGQELTLRCTRL